MMRIDLQIDSARLVHRLQSGQRRLVHAVMTASEIAQEISMSALQAASALAWFLSGRCPRVPATPAFEKWETYETRFHLFHSSQAFRRWRVG